MAYDLDINAALGPAAASSCAIVHVEICVTRIYNLVVEVAELAYWRWHMCLHLMPRVSTDLNIWTKCEHTYEDVSIAYMSDGKVWLRQADFIMEAH